MAFNKKFFTTGGIVASSPEPAVLDPLQNFETVTYTGNGGTQKITGYIRKGAAFNGSSSVISTDLNFATNAKSISLWFKISDTNVYGSVVSSNNNGTGDPLLAALNWHCLQFNSTGNVLTFSILTGNWERVSTTTNNFNVNTWYNVTVTNDASSIKIYINGNLENTTTLTGTILSQDIIEIGGNTNASGTTPVYYNGLIDQVRIFNKALSSSEVTTLYGETYASSTKSTTDILGDGSGVALYELDGDANDTGSNADTVDTADIFEDNSIIDFYQFNGNTQSTNNAPFYSLQTTSTTYGDGILGQSLYLNGSQTASLTANNYGTMNLTGSYSLSLYFNATTVNKRNIIWYLEQINGYTSVIELGSDNKLYFGNATITSQTYSANTWYNVVISFDASNGLIKAYVDGQLLGSRTANTTTGSIQCFGHGGVGLTGYIDQARFFNRVITDSEAAELYEARVKYDGTPTNVNFLGMAFQPDLVWTKSYAGLNWWHFIQDSVRGTTSAIYSNRTDAAGTSLTDAIQSFDSNGYTIGSNGSLNYDSSNDYVAWCFKGGGNSNTYNVDDTGYSTASDAGLSSANATTLNGASVNTQAGFSIINYETNVNGDNRPAHGLTQEPELIIFKPYDTSSLGWYVMTKKIDGSVDFLFLNTTAAKSDAGTNEFIDSTHFRTSFGTVWGSIIAYCFHSVDGYQKIGTYTGTGAAGNQINVGFKPRFIMVKRTDSAGGWVIIDSLRTKELYPHADSIQTINNRLTINDSGFVTVGSAFNESGSTNNFIYLAIA